MAVPSDFDSFALGVDLNSSNYSGGAGGTFTNLVAGAKAWTVDPTHTPSFSTKSGVEGMDFTNVLTEQVRIEHPAQRECTILVVGLADTAAATDYLYGTGWYTVNNGSGLQCNGRRLQAYNASNSSGYTSAVTGADTTPFVYTASFCPRNGTTYAQINDGTVASSTVLTLNGDSILSRWKMPYGAIGAHRAAALSGWVSRVLIFDRALHYRDPTGLASLIATEMTNIGL